ncbi:PspC domain-containing protein [Corynebacterium sp. 335C]
MAIDKSSFNPDDVSRKLDSLTGKTVRRSHSNKWIAGVSGGIGETFGFDPNYLRAAFAIGLVVAFPVSVALYIAGWYFLPKA